MQFILISFVSIIIGAVIGFLFQKSQSQKIIIEKEVLAKEVELLKEQANSFDKYQEESLKSARAVMFEASAQVSAKLLEDHKRENLESRKAAEDITQKTAEGLQQEFKSVVEKLAGLNQVVATQNKKVDGLWQTLSNPTGAGQFAEIGLENMLHAFGLEKDRDFFTQFATNYEGKSLRPDAVIKLSDDNLIVIDSKSSKLFFELSAENVNEAELLEKLKKRMGMHLNDLSSRDYSNAVQQAHKSENGNIINVMYVPSDSAYARVLQSDNQFSQKCTARNIHFADPSRIEFILNLARYNINRAKQEANHQEIVKEMGKVVSSVDNLLRGIDRVGKSLKMAAKSFSDLGGTVNGRLIPRIKNAVALGLKPEKELNLPESIPNFNIIENQSVVIESEIETLKFLDKKAG